MKKNYIFNVINCKGIILDSITILKDTLPSHKEIIQEIKEKLGDKFVEVSSYKLIK